jgi:hypothetical protein
MARPDWKWRGQRKRRVREHVIADMSVNFLERQVLRRSHQLLRIPQPEYGLDAMMLHFADTGEIENGVVFFQAKATDSPDLIDHGKSVAAVVETAHLHYWYWVSHHPVILVLYDAAKHRGFWLDVQRYVDEHSPNVKGDTLTLHIPVSNRLTVRAVDDFRRLSLSRMTRDD